MRVKDRMGEEPNPETEQESEETTNVSDGDVYSTLYSTVHYSRLLYITEHYYKLLYFTVHYYTSYYCILLYFTLSYYTLLYCTLL